MRKYYERVKLLAFSGTAKDTYVVFLGNVFSAFWGFLFTLIVARVLSISDFGIFSATLNLVVILASLTDLGISSGSVNFISEHLAKGETEKAKEYIKASFVVRFLIVMAISSVVIILSPQVSSKLLATNDPMFAVWAAVIPIFLFPDMFFPAILQAKKEFLHSALMDNAFYVARLIFAFGFSIAGALTMPRAFLAFGAGFIVTVVQAVIYIKTDFLASKPTAVEYRKLLGFSGWIGVNRIISSVSGRLDIQMLAAMAGAFATGLYSIPSRLASFIVVLGGSFSAVLAPRLAGFGNEESEKKYILKSLLALLPITAGIIFWIIIAKPFMLLLFGTKYLASVPVFQALAASQIPFLFTVPSVSAIIYSMKKTVFIGAYSFFQIAAIFLLNLALIPKFGPFGPTITFGITNSLLAIYTWVVVIRHYWLKK